MRLEAIATRSKGASRGSWPAGDLLICVTVQSLVSLFGGGETAQGCVMRAGHDAKCVFGDCRKSRASKCFGDLMLDVGNSAKNARFENFLLTSSSSAT